MYEMLQVDEDLEECAVMVLHETLLMKSVFLKVTDAMKNVPLSLTVSK